MVKDETGPLEWTLSWTEQASPQSYTIILRDISARISYFYTTTDTATSIVVNGGSLENFEDNGGNRLGELAPSATYAIQVL